MNILINLIVLFTFLSNITHAQSNVLAQYVNVVSSATEKFSTSSNTISEISVFSAKSFDKQKCVAIYFTTKKLGKSVLIDSDSITLKSSSNKIISMIMPLCDTIYWNETGSLSFNIIHRLNDELIRFLKEEAVINIEIMVDKNPFQIVISRKSQKKIKDFFVKNY